MPDTPILNLLSVFHEFIDCAGDTHGIKSNIERLLLDHEASSETPSFYTGNAHLFDPLIGAGFLSVASERHRIVNSGEAIELLKKKRSFKVPEFESYNQRKKWYDAHVDEIASALGKWYITELKQNGKKEIVDLSCKFLCGTEKLYSCKSYLLPYLQAYYSRSPYPKELDPELLIELEKHDKAFEYKSGRRKPLNETYTKEMFFGTFSISVSSRSYYEHVESHQHKDGLFEMADVCGYQSESGGYCNYNTYLVTGRYKASNGEFRKRTITIKAQTVDKADEKARKSGFVEIKDIKISPSILPTDSRLNYARDLNAILPPSLSSEDLEAIIFRIKDKDESPPNPGFSRWCHSCELTFSRFIGKHALNHIAFRDLSIYHKAILFIYKLFLSQNTPDILYRDIEFNDPRSLGSSTYMIFEDFALQVSGDSSLTRSLENQIQTSDCLEYSPHGNSHIVKEAYKSLVDCGIIKPLPLPVVKTSSTTPSNSKKDQSHPEIMQEKSLDIYLKVGLALLAALVFIALLVAWLYT